MGSKLSGLGQALYDSKRREFLGRDGGRWAKLGVFYFFFYLGLAGFFCAMLAIFMALTPRDHPYYYSHDSRMETRSNPLTPGLGFRPQPIVDRNLIEVNKGADNNERSPNAVSLDNYLRFYYSKPSYERGTPRNAKGGQVNTNEFTLRNVGECNQTTGYGYSVGRPCVLVKLNKIVDFVPEPFTGTDDPDSKEIPATCSQRAGSIPVSCTGEFPADIDNIGRINYISENGFSQGCGSLNLNRFPYMGKRDRQDIYQAPYIWAQFIDPKPNVLINVICRAHAQNIDVDKKAGRGVTRFQLFVKSQNTRATREL